MGSPYTMTTMLDMARRDIGDVGTAMPIAKTMRYSFNMAAREVANKIGRKTITGNWSMKFITLALLDTANIYTTDKAGDDIVLADMAEPSHIQPAGTDDNGQMTKYFDPIDWRIMLQAYPAGYDEEGRALWTMRHYPDPSGVLPLWEVMLINSTIWLSGDAALFYWSLPLWIDPLGTFDAGNYSSIPDEFHPAIYYLGLSCLQASVGQADQSGASRAIAMQYLKEFVERPEPSIEGRGVDENH